MSSSLENADTTVAEYNQTKYELIDQAFVLEPLLPWQTVQQPMVSGEAHCSPFSNFNHSTARPATYLRTRQPSSMSALGRRSYGVYQQPTTHYTYSDAGLQHPITTPFDDVQTGSFCSTSGIPRLVLPSPTLQQLSWTDSMVADSFNEACPPNTQPLEAFPYNAADQAASAIFPIMPGNVSRFGPYMEPAQRGLEEDAPANGCELTHKSRDKGPCYAKLIYEALMEAPGHKMILRDIYSWIVRNTNKAKDPLSKGWQNSVRHNLSMNGDFLKIELAEPENKTKKGFIWVLEPSAVKKGIQSTTRFRPKPGDKKGGPRDGVDRKRQRAAKRGNKAAKRSHRAKSLTRFDVAKSSRCLQSTGIHSVLGTLQEPQQQTAPSMDLGNSNCLPYWIPTPPLSTQSSSPNESCYDFRELSRDIESQQDQYLFENAFGPDNQFKLGLTTNDVKYDDHFLGTNMNLFP